MNIAAPSRRPSSPRTRLRLRSRRLRIAPPLRLTPALCVAIAALCFLSNGSSTSANPTSGPQVASSVQAAEAQNPESALVNLRVGRTLSIPLPEGAKYSVSGKSDVVAATSAGGLLIITPERAGRVLLTIELPALEDEVLAAKPQIQRYTLRVASRDGVFADATDATAIGSPSDIVPLETAVISSGVNSEAIPARAPALSANIAANPVDGGMVASSSFEVTSERIASGAPRVTKPVRTARTTQPNKSARTTTSASRLSSVISTLKGASTPPTRLALKTTSHNELDYGIITQARAQYAPELPGLSRVETRSQTALPTGIPPLEVLDAAPPRRVTPETTRATAAATMAPIPEDDGTVATTRATSDQDVYITSDVPPPNLPASNTSYPLQSPLPPSVDPTAKRPLYKVSQGMARLLAFRSNILSVFFSDDLVMDARAVNARTIAVTGKGPGRSTLAVFLSRYDGDVVGRAVIYNIEVYPTVARPTFAGLTDPTEAENAVRTALNDPRIRVSVLQNPSGGLTVRLDGGLKDQAEVAAAVTTASLFVPNVVSGLYVSPTAPTLEDAIRGPMLSTDQVLQSQLQEVFGNESIRLIPMPGVTILKAEVNSPAEAEAIFSILPSLSRQVQPVIVIRGAEGNRAYTPERPLQYGEEFEMTKALTEVTGIDTVYVKRTARNALALYGTVRNRTEYETVRRYANAQLPQLQENIASASAQITPAGANANTNQVTTATTTSAPTLAPALATAGGSAPAPATWPQTNPLSAQSASTGYRVPVHIQMFVRVLDESASTVRQVTVESNFVEISRDALRDLGTQFGSATVLSETVDGTNGGVTREIDPTFRIGEGLLGDFAGFGAFSNINPVRVRLAALIQNGTARVLSRPNLTSVEGADAQITIGGVRPVPSSQTSASGGATQTSVDFRRFGIILTMRPTLTDDDMIILQIRGDVTDLDFTTAINLSGAIIPGERVRSVDTTVTMREGDTLVLGGLITNETRKQTSKVPILGDIPILGKLFQSKRFENNESELAIFLTPRIQRQRASMNGKNDVERVPGLPPLPGLQDGEGGAFSLSNAGEDG